MRITATCSNCQRDLLLSQLVEGPVLAGRCPWCGTLLAPHYTLLLADTIHRAEQAGTELERALEQLGENWARLHVRAQLLGAEAALHRLGDRRAAGERRAA
jgi:hypothetical protein